MCIMKSVLPKLSNIGVMPLESPIIVRGDGLSYSVDRPYKLIVVPYPALCQEHTYHGEERNEGIERIAHLHITGSEDM